MRPTCTRRVCLIYAVLKAGDAHLWLEIWVGVALEEKVPRCEHRSLWGVSHVLVMDLDVGYTCVCISEK